MSHSLTMRKALVNPNTVISIGADGKLLQSERRSHQWEPAIECLGMRAKQTYSNKVTNKNIYKNDIYI